jgi:hypothetical protein
VGDGARVAPRRAADLPSGPPPSCLVRLQARGPPLGTPPTMQGQGAPPAAHAPRPWATPRPPCARAVAHHTARLRHGDLPLLPKAVLQQDLRTWGRMRVAVHGCGARGARAHAAHASCGSSATGRAHLARQYPADLRDLRGLAGACLSNHDHHLVRLDGLDDVRGVLPDRQRRGAAARCVRHRPRCGAARLALGLGWKPTAVSTPGLLPPTSTTLVLHPNPPPLSTLIDPPPNLVLHHSPMAVSPRATILYVCINTPQAAPESPVT